MTRSRLVALTGGTGFVGSHVAEALLAAGYSVRALARRPHDPSWLKGLDLELEPGDVRDPDSLRRLVAGAGAVVHAAGKVSARSAAEFRATNVEGTANLVAAVRESAPEAHFVLVSSQAAAGPSRDGRPVGGDDPPLPVSTYGASKLEAERAIRAAGGLSFTILRPAAVYGPRETAIRDLFVAASKGFVPLLAGGKPRIQLAYAGDVAAAVLGALERGGKRETFFLAHPEVLDYWTIAQTLSRLRTPPARLVPVPGAVLRIAGLLAGALSTFSAGPPVFNREKADEMLQSAWLCRVDDAQVALGQPFRTTFAEGARLTWEWYEKANWIRRK